ncbi:MAG: hypothetical protein LBH45_03015 [Campylobacteraceae bacterium]|jgi:YD repeat-containing protein|nr:hypothetical protein [Campylobacteraceae bacterium]
MSINVNAPFRHCERSATIHTFHEPYKLENSKRIYAHTNTLRNAAGKLLTQTEYLHDRTLYHTYSYDKQGRLTKASTLHSGIKNEKPSSYTYSEEFSYDNQGNILKHTITDKNQKSIKQGVYDIDDRMELFDDTNYVYDTDGQLIQKQKGGDCGVICNPSRFNILSD